MAHNHEILTFTDEIENGVTGNNLDSYRTILLQIREKTEEPTGNNYQLVNSFFVEDDDERSKAYFQLVSSLDKKTSSEYLEANRMQVIQQEIISDTSSLIKATLRAYLEDSTLRKISGLALRANSPEMFIKNFRKLIEHNTESTNPSEELTFLNELTEVDIGVIYKCATHVLEYYSNPGNREQIYNRILGEHRWHDFHQFEKTALPRNLEAMREKGFEAFLQPENINDSKMVIKADHRNVPLAEKLKNERVFSMSGFHNSKLSLVDHDTFDHYFLFLLASETKILSRYDALVTELGSPEKTDMFKRESEMFASIAFNWRKLLKGNIDSAFVSTFNPERIKRLLSKSSSENTKVALEKLEELLKETEVSARIGKVFDSIIVEFLEQIRTAGNVKHTDGTKFKSLDSEYIGLIVELLYELNRHEDLIRKMLLINHIRLEKYLEDALESPENSMQGVSAFLPKSTKEIEEYTIDERISESKRQWFEKYYYFSSTKKPLTSERKEIKMDIEHEIRVLDVDPEEARERLRNLGFKLVHPERLMRRVIYEPPARADQAGFKSWMRLRDEGNKVTMTIKKEEVIGKKRVYEDEVVMQSSFDETRRFLSSLGTGEVSYQENQREDWIKGGVTVSIDTWPGLNTYLEVEGEDLVMVNGTIEELGYTTKTLSSGGVAKEYTRMYGVSEDDVNRAKEITFNSKFPDIFNQ